MDTRPTPEQAELQRTARQLARELGPRAVSDLDDAKRHERLAEAVRDAGWLELRDDDGEGGPVASGVEAALIAEALGEAVADVAFAGPVLAADLARRAGASAAAAASVAFEADLVTPAIVSSGGETDAPLVAVDAGAGTAYVLVAEGDGHRLATVEPGEAIEGSDLTRTLRPVAPGARVTPVDASRALGHDDLDAWTALGLALTSADLVGLMRGVVDASVAYAGERKQYGVAIGSFQAVQHLLAEAHTLLEGAASAAAHPSWAADALAPDEARATGRVAKAYCARAARTVCETAVQVHGGIGNTWDCMVHVHLRRALLSSQWFGDDGEMLRQLERTRLGVADGGLGVPHGLS
jgi:alkylation response protein AidB-like acyl-CoA dehydrogenase